ncbi:MAG: RND superfamily putative drug exporter [Verrucomicrobiales bacterium]|jgi:RND superfamily putative drug exporter
MFSAISSFPVRRPKAALAIWLVALMAFIVLGSGVVDRLETVPVGDTNTESQLVEDTLAELGASSPDVVALYDGIDVTNPTLAQEVRSLDERLSRTTHVSNVFHTFDEGPLFTSIDGEATIISVVLDRSLPEAEFEELVETVEAELRSIDAPQTLVGGVAILDRESVEQTERDLQKAELITLPITLIAAIVVFGGVLAAMLPLAIALVAIPGSMFVLWLLTQVTDVQLFALNAATMLGLGLSIDYALLIVNRFREERALGKTVADAVTRTVGTAGRTVTFSGVTVALALGGFLMMSGNVFPSIGMGSIGVVILAMLAANTLLPALLMLIGHRIKPAKNSEDSGAVFGRVAQFVQRRATIVAVVVAGVLLLLATPFAGVRLQIPGAESLPESLETRQLLDIRDERFAVGGEDPITIVASIPGDVSAYMIEIEQLPNVLGAQVRFATEAITVIDVLPNGTAQSETAEGVVGLLRTVDPGFDTAIGGPAAELIDQRDALLARTPWALAFVAGSTLLLLFLLTGSVVMPFKAMAMNLLSLTATFGLLVWGFQDGNLERFLGFESPGFIGLWNPFLVFFLAFGLSMDYEVFLLSRIKEIHDETGDNDLAVTIGLQKTGRVITSAALLIAIVFGAFATGESLDMKVLGVGLAAAILIDASIVRMLFVPAAMKLMGEWNWWAPAPLRRFHDRFGLSEGGRPNDSGPSVDLDDTIILDCLERESDLVG